MKQFFKRHIGLIIFIIILLVFPVSLSNQVKLNMRVIVTGIAIDKSEDEYEVTAQIVNPSSGSESPGQSAQLNFMTDKGETVSKALANLMYKTGKVSAFSHTSFVILGNDIDEEDVTKCLDVFVRDKVIKNSALVLFAKDKAKDEIKKTKDLELSVGLGLQKVYTFKQEESDGLMITILDFLNRNKTYGKTSVASVLELEDSSGECGQSSSSCGSSGGPSSGGVSGGGEGSSSSGSSGGDSCSSGGGSASAGGSSSGGGGSGGGSSGGGSSSGGDSSGGGSGESKSKMSFKTCSCIKCFVDGKLACKLSEEDETLGYMLATSKTRSSYIDLDDIDYPELADAMLTIVIKDKIVSKKTRYEDEIPCLDLKITITNSEINEVLSSNIVSEFSDEEYKAIEIALRKAISEKVSKTFEKAKESGADIFNAYENAYKYNYSKLKEYNKLDEKDFIKNLKLNVKVVIKKLDY